MPVKASAEKRELILKIYKYFGAESKRKAPFYAWNKVIDRTVQALDISRSFLNKILKKEPVELNEKSVNKCKDSLDSFDKDLIRRVVVGFFSKNEYVSIRKLRVTLEKNHSLKVSKYKLWKTLHELGFRYAKINGNKKALVERKDLVNKRIIFLRTIKQKRNEGYSIVYLDETWVDTHHTASHQWTPPNPSDARKIPLNKGQRFVILHAGCKTGFLPGCELVFKTLSTDGRDYHSEMNSVIFNKWVEEQLVPALPPKSLVVMDNASYHSVIKEGTKAPTSATRKGDMQKWLKDKKIPFDGKMKKTELYEIIKLKKPEPVHKTDEFLRGKGHDVLRLPPYHCEFNPIEMVWGDVKGYVGRENNTFKTNDVKDLIIKGFKTITPEKWTNFCNHVENKIEPQYWKSDHIIEEIPKIIINLDSDSDTDSEGDHDSEGETTDMYWSE